MAKRNQVTTNLKISANAHLNESRGFLNQLNKIIDQFDFGDKLNAQLRDAEQKVKSLNKVLEKVQNKSFISDDEMKELNKATKEITNIVAKTEKIYTSLNTNELKKFSKDYIRQIEEQEKQVAKIKEKYSNETGSNFDKDIEHLDEYKTKVKQLDAEIKKLNSNQDDRINEKIKQQNNYLQEQFELMQKIKKAENELSLQRNNIYSERSKKTNFSVEELQSKVRTDRPTVTRDIANNEYKKMVDSYNEIERKKDEILESGKDEAKIEKDLIKLAQEYNLKNVRNTEEFNKQLSLLEKQKNYYRLLNNRDQLASEKAITTEIERRQRLLREQKSITEEIAEASKMVLSSYNFDSMSDLETQKRNVNRTLGSSNVVVTNTGASLSQQGEDDIANEVVAATKEQTTKLTQELSDIKNTVEKIVTTSEKLATQSERAADEQDVTDMKKSVNGTVDKTGKDINKHTTTDNERNTKLLLHGDMLKRSYTETMPKINSSIGSLTNSKYAETAEENKELFHDTYTKLINSIDYALTGEGSIDEMTMHAKEFDSLLKELTDALAEEITTREKILQKEINNIEKNPKLSKNQKEEEKNKQYQDFSKEGLQFTNYQKSINGIRGQLPELMDFAKNTVNPPTTAVQTYTKALEQNQKAVAKASEESQYLGTVWEDFKNKAAYFLSANYAIDMVTRQFQQASAFAKDLDKDMAQIGLVLQETSTKAWQNFNTYSRMADRLSTTTSEVTAAMKLFYQQGLNTAEVNKMVEASAIAAALGESTMAEASETLTSIVNSYQLSANQALEVTDKISQVAIVSAADFGEISTAIEKVASSAATAGVDLDHMMGYLAKMIETTREAPTNVGTALKTIVANFEQFKEDPSQLNVNGSDINKVDTALKSVGISLLDSEGQIKDLSIVLDELGGKWQGLSRNQKAYLATQIAGTRQQSRFFALMNDYDRTLELVNESTNSSGKATKQFALYQNSLTAATQRLKNESEKFYKSLTQGDGLLKNVYNTLTNLLKIVNQIGPVWSAIFGTVGLKSLRNFYSQIAKSKDLVQDSLSTMLEPKNFSGKFVEGNKKQTAQNISAFLPFNTGKGKASKFFNGTGRWTFEKLVSKKDLKLLNEYNDILKTIGTGTAMEMTAGYESLTQAQKGQIDTLAQSLGMELVSNIEKKEDVGATAAQVVAKGADTTATNINTAAKWANVAAQAVMTAGVTILIAGIGMLVNKLMNANQAEREAAAAAEEAYNEISTEVSALEDSIETYESLSKKISLTNEEKEELISINNELADIYPDLIQGYDSEGNAIINNTKLLEKYIDKKEEAQQAAKTSAAKSVNASKIYNKGIVQEGWIGIGGNKIRSDEDITSDAAKTTYERLQASYETFKQEHPMVTGFQSISGWNNFYHLMRPDATVGDARSALNSWGLDKNDEKTQKEIVQLFNDSKTFYGQMLEGISDNYQTYYDETAGLFVKEQKTLNEEEQQFVESLGKTFIRDKNDKKVNEIIEQYKNGEKSYKKAGEEIQEYLENEGQENAQEILQGLQKVVKSSSYQKFQKLYEEYTQAQSEGYSTIIQNNLAQKLIDEINKMPGLTTEQKNSIIDGIKKQQDEVKQQTEDAIKQAMESVGLEYNPEETTQEIDVNAEYDKIKKQGNYYGENELKRHSIGRYIKSTKTGNIDLNNRKVGYNENGEYMTEENMSFLEEQDGEFVVTIIPTVVDGNKLDDEAAKQHYYETGQHLGQFVLDGFNSVEEADKYLQLESNPINAYANDLHMRQQNTYKNFEKKKNNSEAYKNVFEQLNLENQQRLSEAINNFQEDTELGLSEDEKKKISQALIPSISEILDDETIGEQFKEDLENLDFTDSISVENFKARYGEKMTQVLMRETGFDEGTITSSIDKYFSDPGVVLERLQENIGKLKDSFGKIGELDVETLMGGEMTVFDAAEAKLLDSGFTVGDKFIASTDVIMDSLGEQNKQMQIYIEELRRSAVKDIEEAQQAIQDIDAQMEQLKNGRNENDLSKEEKESLDNLKKDKVEQEKSLSIAQKRLANAKNLTAEYKRQAKEMDYIDKYSEVQDAANSVNTLVNSITDLADAWEKANEGSLSQLDIIKMIAESDGEYLKFLEVQNGQLVLSAQNMEAWAETQANVVKQSIELDIKKLESLYNMIDADKIYTAEEIDELTTRADNEVEAAKDSQEVKQGEINDLVNVAETYNDAATDVNNANNDMVSSNAEGARASSVVWQNLASWLENSWLGKISNAIGSFRVSISNWIASGFKDWNYSTTSFSKRIRQLTTSNTYNKKDTTTNETSKNNSTKKWSEYSAEDYSQGMKGSDWKAQITDKIAKLRAIQNAISGKDLLKKVNEMGSGSNKDKDAYEASVEHLEHFYNYLRKIESLEAKIQKLQTKRSTLDLTTNYNIDSLKEENALLREQASLYNSYVGEEVGYLAQLRNQLKAAYGDWVYFTNEGVVQVTQTDFAINSEAEEKRYDAFNELLEEYQSEYQTYLENQNKLLEIQSSIIQNIKSMYDKILQQLEDVTTHLEHLQSISEHQADMSLGNLDKLSAYNQELSATLQLYSQVSKNLGDIRKDMQLLEGKIGEYGVGQYMTWNNGTNQYQTSDLFNQGVLNGTIDGNTVTIVQAIVAASQTLNEQWRNLNDKVMSTESSLKQIAESRLSAITDLIDSWKDQITSIMDIVNRQISTKDSFLDLTGYNSADLEEKYELLASGAILARQGWEEMKKAVADALGDLKARFGQYVKEINGVPFIDETSAKESIYLTNEEKMQFQELATTVKKFTEGSQDMEDSMYNMLNTMKEMREQKLQSQLDILQQIHDELRAIAEEEVDDLQKKYDEMSRLDSEYYSKLQQKIQDARNTREDRQSQIQTDQLRAQIAIMQKDNTSQYNQQLINLQKQLNDQLQEQADAEIDRELERIEREQQEREEDREMQIQQLENLITFKDENKLYWEEANQMYEQGYQQVAGFLATREQNKDQSELATQEAIGTLNDTLTIAYTKLGDYNKNIDSSTATTRDMFNEFLRGSGNNTVSGLLNALNIGSENINKELRNNLQLLSTNITSGINMTKDTISQGYLEFWRQFGGVNTNIGTLQSGVISSGTGIINQIGATGNVASRDAGVIQGLQQAAISATNSAASNAGRAASNIDQLNRDNGIRNNTLNGTVAEQGSAIKGLRQSLDSARLELLSINSNTSNLKWHLDHTLWETYQNVLSLNKRKEIRLYGAELSGGFFGGLGASISMMTGNIYKKGGYVDYTGPAWVDGTKNAPEAFLNSRQTALFENLRDTLVDNSKTTRKSSETKESNTEKIEVGEVNVNVQEIADMGTLIKDSIDQMKQEIMYSINKQTAMRVRR